MLVEITNTKDEWERVEAEETSVNDALDRFQPLHSESTTGSGRSRRTTANTQNYRIMANPDSRAASGSDEEEALRTALHAAKSTTNEKLNAHVKAVNDIDTFKNNNLTSKEDFYEHGVKAVKPIFEDYKRLFLAASGDYSKLVGADHAARVLNPLEASKRSHTKIKEAVQDLTHFCFDEFRSSSGMIDDMIEQIPSYMVKVQSTTSEFWRNVAGAEEYDAKLTKKAADDPEKYGSAT